MRLCAQTHRRENACFYSLHLLCSEVLSFYIGIKVFHLAPLNQSDNLTFKRKLLRTEQWEPPFKNSVLKQAGEHDSVIYQSTWMRSEE